jgi:hypothetical protein
MANLYDINCYNQQEFTREVCNMPIVLKEGHFKVSFLAIINMQL